ncbi:MAG: hypothetical protein ACFFCQ_08550 [Promethearchaeota archaeon]
MAGQNIIIAGNMKQYEYFIKHYKILREYFRYVNDIRQVDGIRLELVVCTGTYWENPIWHDQRQFDELKVRIRQFRAKLIYEKEIDWEYLKEKGLIDEN